MLDSLLGLILSARSKRSLVVTVAVIVWCVISLVAGVVWLLRKLLGV